MARRRDGGRFSVGDDPRSFHEVGPAVSLAITLATRASEARTFYVKELGNPRAHARVTRDAKDVIYVEGLGG